MRKVLRAGAADKDGKRGGGRKDIPDPGGKAGPGRCFVEEKYKKDEGAQDLGLVFGGASSRGIERSNEFRDLIRVEVDEFLPFLILEAEGIFGVVA